MTDQRPRDRVWEVFRQESEGDPMVHGGSVRAPDEELALHYAREFYGRLIPIVSELRRQGLSLRAIA